MPLARGSTGKGSECLVQAPFEQISPGQVGLNYLEKGRYSHTVTLAGSMFRGTAGEQELHDLPSNSMDDFP